MLNLFRHSSFGIGVDIGSSSIKVVGLLKTREGIALTTYASALQRNLLMDASVPDGVPTMAAVIREMFRRSRISRGQFVAALPSLSVFSTVLEFPEMPERELEQAVILAAKQAVPTPLENVVLGWVPIGAPREHPPKPHARENGTLESGSPAGESLLSQSTVRPPEDVRRLRTRKAQEVFLTAAPRDLVGRYMELFERLSIELTALEVESFPLSRSLLQGERGPVVLVDFGSRMTNFSIVEDRYFRVNQAVDIGGEAMTNAIAERTSLDPVAAERAKRTEGLAGSSDALPKSPGGGGTASPRPLREGPSLPDPGEAIVSPVVVLIVIGPFASRCQTWWHRRGTQRVRARLRFRSRQSRA